METLHSTSGPSDERCIEFDNKMTGKYDIEPFKKLGYDSIHMCLRDKIMNGENIKEISDSTGLITDTIKNAAVRMYMRIKPIKRGTVSINQIPWGKQDRRGPGPYPEHPCSVPGCTNMTTHRFLCSDCFFKNGELDETDYL